MQEQMTEKTDLTLISDKFNFKNALYFIEIRSDLNIYLKISYLKMTMHNECTECQEHILYLIIYNQDLKKL